MKRITLLLFISTLWLVSAEAQKAWTLEACISQALKQNISLKMNEVTLKNQRINLENAKNQRLPGAYLSASQSVNFGQSLNAQGYYEYGNSQSYSGSISASATLFSGFQIANNIKAQQLNLLATIEDLKTAQDNMSVSVASSFLQVLYDKEIYQTALEQEKLTQQQLDRYIEMAKLGKIPEGQVAEIRSQLAQNKLTSTQAHNNLTIALLDLSQLLEISGSKSFDVEVPAIDMEGLVLKITPVDEVYAYAVSKKSFIKASELRLKSSEKQLQIAEGAYYPSLSIGASMGTGFYGGSTSLIDQLDLNSRTSVGLSLSVPLFNRFDTKNSVRSAKLDIENATLSVENAKKTLYKDIQQAWSNALTAMEKYNASKEAVKQSEIAYQFAKEKFDNGRSTAYDYFSAQTNLASATSNLLQAKYNYVFCVKILDFYKGENLTL
jgi:outer membrane protein